jgi:hypothetical protein
MTTSKTQVFVTENHVVYVREREFKVLPRSEKHHSFTVYNYCDGERYWACWEFGKHLQFGLDLYYINDEDRERIRII